MAVLSNISVGDIQYYVVNDVPTHSAPKGSVYIMDDGNIKRLFINNDGNTTWLKSIKPSYCEILRYDSTTGIDFDTLTIGNWYVITSSWVLGEQYGDLGFDGINSIRYTADTPTFDLPPIKTLSTQNQTIIAGPSKWMLFSIGVDKDGFASNKWNDDFGYTASGYLQSSATRVDTTVKGSYYNAGISPLAREAGGGPAASRTFTLRHYSLDTVVLDEGYWFLTLDEGWESSGFTQNGWTTANDPLNNVWYVGGAQKTGGTQSVYITTYASSGASATYASNGVNTNVSHFWKNFSFPSNSSIILTFNWKCGGNNVDGGFVVIEDTGTTVTGGVQNTTTVATAPGNGRIGGGTNGIFSTDYVAAANTTWQTETIDLSGWAGTNKKLIFEWFNSAVTDVPPGFIIDNIKIYITKFDK